jgi:alkylation response protein AidB-like acyl-CoA dehydrogenase
MNLSLSDEQEMLREAARDALARLSTIANAREALDGAPLIDVWSTAREAGWIGLLVPELAGGAGLGTFDAMLVLEQCGRRLAGAGLLGHLPATLVLSRAEDLEVLPALAAGDQRAAMVHARPPRSEESWEAPRVASDGRVSGVARFVPDAAGADWLVVAAVDESGSPCAVLVESTAPGLEVERVVRYDATRPLGNVTFTQASGRVLDGVGADQLSHAWYLAQALLAAEALGVIEAMLELSVAYVKDRYAFGRPIGSYQAIKQQVVDILRHASTTRSLCFFVGVATERELALATSAARFAGEEGADYATWTCIAVHGGIGATWEHDAHLYWRRSQLSRLLLGGVADAGDRVAEEIIDQATQLQEATT